MNPPLTKPYRIRYNHWLFRFPPLSHYQGITLGRTIFFRGTEVEVSKALLDHELMHRAQIEKYGTFQFYWIYCRDYLYNLWRYKSHRAAYLNIPFEKEARGEEKTV